MIRKEKKVEIATPDEVKQHAPSAESEVTGAAADAEAAAAAAAPEDPMALLQADVEQWKDKTLRARAELQNYQRRSEQERIEAIRYANAGFAKSLLDVVDSMERAIEHVGSDKGGGDAVAQAIHLIHDNLQKVLRQHGLTVIDAEAQPFNPAVHEAMMTQPSDKHAEPTVLQVLQKGYKLHDRVIRPAKVIVSKAPDPSAESEAPATD